MLEFMNKVIRMSEEFPGVDKIIISKSMWTALCEFFDDHTDNEHGHTKNFIKEKDGYIKFGDIRIEEGKA